MRGSPLWSGGGWTPAGGTALLFVVFTERGENIRLISARLATESERRLYYDQNFYD